MKNTKRTLIQHLTLIACVLFSSCATHGQVFRETSEKTFEFWYPKVSEDKFQTGAFFLCKKKFNSGFSVVKRDKNSNGAMMTTISCSGQIDSSLSEKYNKTDASWQPYTAYPGFYDYRIQENNSH